MSGNLLAQPNTYCIFYFYVGNAALTANSMRIKRKDWKEKKVPFKLQLLPHSVRHVYKKKNW